MPQPAESIACACKATTRWWIPRGRPPRFFCSEEDCARDGVAVTDTACAMCNDHGIGLRVAGSSTADVYCTEACAMARDKIDVAGNPTDKRAARSEGCDLVRRKNAARKSRRAQ